MNRKRLNITPAQLRSIILSHGWFTLRPFSADINTPRISVAFDLSVGSGAFSVIGKKIISELRSISGDPDVCFSVAEKCLSLDIDPNKLYIEDESDKWRWLREYQMGRFLRSPSLFEDCCKAILSTNTVWQRTIHMVEKLVILAGKSVDSMIAFPTPQAILKLSESKLRNNVECGYRAKYLLHLAEVAAVREGMFLAAGWERLSNVEFHSELNDIKGLGPISINYLSLLYWKPNGYNIDTYVQRRCRELWGVNDGFEDFFNKRYRKFRAYAPIVLWFDITKHWHEKNDFERNSDW